LRRQRPRCSAIVPIGLALVGVVILTFSHTFYVSNKGGNSSPDTIVILLDTLGFTFLALGGALFIVMGGRQ
jgi:hypothetical protein